MPCIADDSGLCIEQLKGFPGVNTARFLGENATQEDRNNDLIKRLKGKTNRKALFITVITYFDERMGNIITSRGTLEGYISKEKRGTNGFGFDEIFELKDGRTLAELTDEEKNKISSRKIALENLKMNLEKML